MHDAALVQVVDGLQKLGNNSAKSATPQLGLIPLTALRASLKKCESSPIDVHFRQVVFGVDEVEELAAANQLHHDIQSFFGV